MQAVRTARAEDIEILPVTVVVRDFPARPSAVPNIRDFVREELARTPLSGDDIRVLGDRVADVLLEAAGTGDRIQVLLRIFAGQAEVDLLRTDQAATIGNTAPLTAPPAPAGSARRTGDPAGGAAAPTGRPGPGDQVPDAVPFARWLAGALRRDGMTMEAAARRLGVSVKTVSRWVGGATEPRLRDLSRMREVFGELPFP